MTNRCAPTDAPVLVARDTVRGQYGFDRDLMLVDRGNARLLLIEDYSFGDGTSGECYRWGSAYKVSRDIEMSDLVDGLKAKTRLQLILGNASGYLEDWTNSDVQALAETLLR